MSLEIFIADPLRSFYDTKLRPVVKVYFMSCYRLKEDAGVTDLSKEPAVSIVFFAGAGFLLIHNWIRGWIVKENDG